MTDFTGRVLVLGANGETGKRVVAALARKGIAVRAMVRSAAKAAEIVGTTDVFVGGISRANVRAALEGMTAIISALGTRSMNDLSIKETEYTTITEALQAAQETGVTHFVLCSSMGTSTPEMIPPLTDVLRAKHEAEEAVKQSGLTYTIVHPGGLRSDPGGQDVRVAQHPLMAMGSISREDVAEVLVQALLQPEARGKSVDSIDQPGQGPADRTGLFHGEEASAGT